MKFKTIVLSILSISIIVASVFVTNNSFSPKIEEKTTFEIVKTNNDYKMSSSEALSVDLSDMKIYDTLVSEDGEAIINIYTQLPQVDVDVYRPKLEHVDYEVDTIVESLLDCEFVSVKSEKPVFYYYRINFDKKNTPYYDEEILEYTLAKEYRYDCDYLRIYPLARIMAFEYNELGIISYSNQEIVNIASSIVMDENYDTFIADYEDSGNVSMPYYYEGILVPDMGIKSSESRIYIGWGKLSHSKAVEYSDPKEAIESLLDSEISCDVVDMEMVYTTKFNSKHSKYLEPAWMVTGNDGVIYYINAINKELFTD